MKNNLKRNMMFLLIITAIVTILALVGQEDTSYKFPSAEEPGLYDRPNQ